MHPIGPRGCFGCQRRPAVAAHGAQERPFGRNFERAFAVVERLHEFGNVRPVACLDPDRALSDGGQEAFFVQDVGLSRHQPETIEPRGGQDGCVHHALAVFAQACIHVAAQRFDAQVRPKMQQQRLPAQAAGPDPGAVGQRGQRLAAAADEYVARVCASRYRAQRQAVGEDRR